MSAHKVHLTPARANETVVCRVEIRVVWSQIFKEKVLQLSRLSQETLIGLQGIYHP